MKVVSNFVIVAVLVALVLAEAPPSAEKKVDEDCVNCLQIVRGLYANFGGLQVEAKEAASTPEEEFLKLVPEVCAGFPQRLAHLAPLCRTFIPHSKRIFNMWKSKTTPPVACGSLGVCPLKNKGGDIKEKAEI